MKKRIRWTEGVHYGRLPIHRRDGMKYEMLSTMVHLGPDGYEKTIKKGRMSNGADKSKDLCPEAFFLHDEFCKFPFWDCGEPITNWQASKEYRKILLRYGFKVRGRIRFYATFLLGGWKVKRVGGWV